MPVPLTGLLQVKPQIQKPGLEHNGTATGWTDSQCSFPCPGTVCPSFLVCKTCWHAFDCLAVSCPERLQEMLSVKEGSLFKWLRVQFVLQLFFQISCIFVAFFVCLVVGLQGGVVCVAWSSVSDRGTIRDSLPRQNSSLSKKDIGDWKNGHEVTPSFSFDVQAVSVRNFGIFMRGFFELSLLYHLSSQQEQCFNLPPGAFPFFFVLVRLLC